MSVHSLRRFTVGGSDCAAAAGVHPYLSPVMLWLQKTGRVDVPETEAMRWGAALQEVITLDIAERYEVEAVLSLDAPLTDPTREWVTGTPDGLVVDETGRTCVLEVKTANGFAYRSGWEHEPPVHYVGQAQWYMHLTGLDRTLLAVLVGGQKLHEHWVARDQRAIDLLLDAGERFYGNLLRDVPPAPDGSDSSRDALLAMYPQSKPTGVVRLTLDQMADLDALRILRDRRDAIERHITEGENRLRAIMGEAESAVSPTDIEVARWPSVTSRRVDTKRLRADRPDIAGEYENETHTRRLTII